MRAVNPTRAYNESKAAMERMQQSDHTTNQIRSGRGNAKVEKYRQETLKDPNSKLCLELGGDALSIGWIRRSPPAVWSSILPLIAVTQAQASLPETELHLKP